MSTGQAQEPPQEPLYVQVAKVRGWTGMRATYPQSVGMIKESENFPAPGMPRVVWVGHPPFRLSDPRHPEHANGCMYGWEGGPCECDQDGELKVPRYDRSWEVTGPLIERFRICLRPSSGGGWAACRPNDEEPPGRWQEYHGSALVSVCNLILALAEAGKLHE